MPTDRHMALERQILVRKEKTDHEM